MRKRQRKKNLKKALARGVLCFVGTARWGPLNEAQVIRTRSEFEEIFGPLRREYYPYGGLRYFTIEENR